MEDKDIRVTARAPVNVAVIKYCGRSDKKLKIPINDSISATLNMNDMCTKTTVHISSRFDKDRFWLNGVEQNIDQPESLVRVMLMDLKSVSNMDKKILDKKVNISCNNFPTAAGLACSAAGYACLAYALGNTYGVTDRAILSKIARKGSGSACRSIYGRFVHWVRGNCHDNSLARQIAAYTHWPEMRAVICIVNENQKDVSSSQGMFQSVDTSSLIKYRADVVVPERVKMMEEAVIGKDFATFAELTMRDSNQFHAICLDTYPPIFYLNDTSRHIIRICSLINQYYSRPIVAYTFDAGPNACIFLLDEHVPIVLDILRIFFPTLDGSNSSSEVPIRGRVESLSSSQHNRSLEEFLKSNGILPRQNSLSYVISTSVGEGPELLEEHIELGF